MTPNQPPTGSILPRGTTRTLFGIGWLLYIPGLLGGVLLGSDYEWPSALFWAGLAFLAPAGLLLQFRILAWLKRAFDQARTDQPPGRSS